jgi:transcription elongation factor Elf1
MDPIKCLRCNAPLPEDVLFVLDHGKGAYASWCRRCYQPVHVRVSQLLEDNPGREAGGVRS